MINQSIHTPERQDGYQFEMQPQLVEETVVRAVSGLPDEKQYRQERERLYEMENAEEREQDFQQLHERWFRRLGLQHPLLQAFEQYPILKRATHRCLLLKARSPKHAAAELYVASDDEGVDAIVGRTIMLQVTAELLSQPAPFLKFLRHELLHLVDMLEPSFGYQPVLPDSGAGPAYDHFLQQRYRVLWDITIDGRLYNGGWFSDGAREKHWLAFKRTFPGIDEQLETAFSHFFDSGQHTHQELVAYAQNPESMHGTVRNGSSTKGRCALCHFPSFQLLSAANVLSTLVKLIQQDNPAWREDDRICQQCRDLYAARLAETTQCLPPDSGPRL